jgi:hypothetical protein
VTSHRWNDKWFGAKFTQSFNRAAQQINALSQPATSTTDCNCHSARDIAGKRFDYSPTSGPNDISNRIWAWDS